MSSESAPSHQGFPPFSFTKTFHHTLYPSIDPTNPLISNNLKDKVVFITGGGRGLGKAIAKSFALADARGVIILGRTTANLESAVEEIQAQGTKTLVKAYVGDIVDRQTLVDAINSAKKEIGPIDIFISNAGDFFPGTIADCDPDEYWRSVEMNIKGTLNSVQAFLKHGVEPGRSTPALINLATVGVHLPPYPGMSAYAVSKIGSHTMMRYLQTETEGRLRVFSIHPGTIATDMAAKAGIPTADDPELPGGFCVWLAATKEADFLQGRLLWANWDVEELLARKDEILQKDMLHMVLGGWADGV